MKKRMLSMLVVIAMLIGLVPANVFATTETTSTVTVDLMLKVVDEKGNEIDGTLDAGLYAGDAYLDWISNTDANYYTTKWTLNVGENTIKGWDYYPYGYVKPTDDITFTVDADGKITVTSDNATVLVTDTMTYIVVILTRPYEGVSVNLMLKAVDKDGNEIIPVYDEDGYTIANVLDVRLYTGDTELDYINNADSTDWWLKIGENTLTDWDYCPGGYVKPTKDITFTVDADGKITVTSDNATVEVEGSTTYIVITLAAASPTLNGMTVSVGEDLSVNYFVQMSYAYKDAVMYVKMPNGETVELTASDEYFLDYGHFMFTLEGLPPQTMGDTPYLTVKLGDKVLVEGEGMSIRDYAENLLTDETYADSDLMRRLVSDMLYYGAAAQEYTGYKTDALVTDGVEGLCSPSEELPDATDMSIDYSTSETVGFASVGVWFDYNNRIYVKLSTTANVRLLVNDEEVTLEGTTYMTDGIPATDFDAVYTFELYEGDTLVQTLTYSVNSYAYAKMNQTDDEGDLTAMAKLSRALYNYGASAWKFLDHINQGQ